MGRTGSWHMGSAADKSKEKSWNVRDRRLQRCPDTRAFAHRCARSWRHTAVQGAAPSGGSFFLRGAQLAKGDHPASRFIP